jgi:hypothetical protein
MRVTYRVFLASLLLILIVGALPSSLCAGEPSPATPGELVATYNSVADAILATNQAEKNIVRSILASTFGHGWAELGKAQRAIAAKDAAAAKTAIENVATAVSQLGTEGDNAVGAVRKKLLEGGHHHNAAGEAKGEFEEGYVIVTRAAKQSFVTSSRVIAQLAAKPTAEALNAEWAKVEATYKSLSLSVK